MFRVEVILLVDYKKDVTLEYEYENNQKDELVKILTEFMSKKYHQTIHVVYKIGDRSKKLVTLTKTPLGMTSTSSIVVWDSPKRPKKEIHIGIRGALYLVDLTMEYVNMYGVTSLESGSPTSVPT